MRNVVRFVLFFTIACAGFSAQASSQAKQLSGYATVIDAGLIAIRGEKIALAYIKAPKLTDACPAAPQRKCGLDASFALAALIERHQVSCQIIATDTSGTNIGICNIGPYDISLSMISRGWAHPITTAPAEYHEYYARAQTSGVGMWAKSATKYTTPCIIKGIVQGTKRYFMAPQHPLYAQTTVDPAKGDQWLCTEQQAIFAGWKKLP
jgi:endonuclease YncB( thermonuclease family)